MSPPQAWQLLAKSFRITTILVRRDRLPEDYQPQDAIELCKESLSTYEHSVLSFLVHVWNRYDFPFELSEIAGWDEEHQRAFYNWANGRTLGRPCRYF
jgi:hypothetical protein